MSLIGRFASRVAAKRAVFPAVCCLSSLLCALVAVNSASAEPADDDRTDDEPAALQVGDVVVTATRTETSAAQVASSVTVVTSEEIERRQLRLVTDVLRRVPGVDVRRTGGPGTTTSIFVRGGNSNHVLVLLDGVELNDPSSPSRAPTLNDLTTEDIERIEVVRGPQSVLYGGDAMSGVIQIFTKRGSSGKPKIVGSGEGGSYSTARGVVSVSGATDDLNYAISGSYWSTDGFSAKTEGIERDSYRNGTASARVGWKLNEQFSLDSMFRYSDAKAQFDGFFREKGHHIDSEQLLARFAPKLSLFDGRWVQTLSSQFSRNERDTSGDSPSRFEGNLYALDWQNEVRVVEGHLVTLGLEQQWEEADVAAFDDSRDNFAVYLQDQISWGERLFGTAGFRYDNSSDFESKVTYRFTAGFSVPEIHTIFRSSYGTGYKAPSLFELNSNTFGGNPNLDPEKSEGVDVGFETSLCNDRFVATGTFFYNDVHDLIFAVDVNPDPFLFDFLNFNVDHSEAYGVEATVDLEIIKNLRFTGNYTFTHTEVKGAPAGFGIEDGSRLLRRPTHKASIDLIWDFLDNRGELAANVLYVGDRRDLHPVTFSAVTASDYVTLNLTGR
ncbi:MAG: TonB-dependent receptor, partial [Myxococcales bacterium]|nr:TonB-dependent receptor [Myxococcales bacterium]